MMTEKAKELYRNLAAVLYDCIYNDSATEGIMRYYMRSDFNNIGSRYEVVNVHQCRSPIWAGYNTGILLEFPIVSPYWDAIKEIFPDGLPPFIKPEDTPDSRLKRYFMKLGDFINFMYTGLSLDPERKIPRFRIWCIIGDKGMQVEMASPELDWLVISETDRHVVGHGLLQYFLDQKSIVKRTSITIDYDEFYKETISVEPSSDHKTFRFTFSHSDEIVDYMTLSPNDTIGYKEALFFVLGFCTASDYSDTVTEYMEKQING